MRRRDHEQIVGNLRDEVRYLRRQNENLQDRLMYVSGSTWTPPPPPENDLDLPEVEPYTFTPEQDFDAAPPGEYEPV